MFAGWLELIRLVVLNQEVLSKVLDVLACVRAPRCAGEWLCIPRLCSGAKSWLVRKVTSLLHIDAKLASRSIAPTTTYHSDTTTR